jgi:hypothetical protein
VISDRLVGHVQQDIAALLDIGPLGVFVRCVLTPRAVGTKIIPERVNCAINRVSCPAQLGSIGASRPKASAWRWNEAMMSGWQGVGANQLASCRESCSPWTSAAHASRSRQERAMSRPMMMNSARPGTVWA